MNKNRLGYALFPGDYAIWIKNHNTYQGHEIFAKRVLIVKMYVNGIEVASMSSHTEETWLDHYPETYTVFDDVQIVNGIEYNHKNKITYVVDTEYRNSNLEEVEQSELLPMEFAEELGNKVSKEGKDFWVYDYQKLGTKYCKENKENLSKD